MQAGAVKDLPTNLLGRSLGRRLLSGSRFSSSLSSGFGSGFGLCSSFGGSLSRGSSSWFSRSLRGGLLRCAWGLISRQYTFHKSQGRVIELTLAVALAVVIVLALVVSAFFTVALAVRAVVLGFAAAFVVVLALVDLAVAGLAAGFLVVVALLVVVLLVVDLETGFLFCEANHGSAQTAPSHSISLKPYLLSIIMTSLLGREFDLARDT